MTPAVHLVVVDDAGAAMARGSMERSRPFADGFPRREDLEALDARERGAAVWFVESDGAVVGTCGTHGPPGTDGTVELGWGLVESARGNGVGAAAVALLIDAVARVHPAATLVATTQWVTGTKGPPPVAESPASEAILARLGFATGPAPAAHGRRVWQLGASQRPQPIDAR